MKSFAILAVAATAIAQTAPSGCQASVSGTFNIETVNVSKKRDIEARQLSGTLTLSLQNGILKDQAGRQGYIASNYQFQFDSPLQAGARESTGFSLCNNGSLALGASRPAGAAVWFQCLSGTFYNLYSQSTGAQCVPITIQAVNRASGSASQISDGQAQASSARSVVSQISDGQPQASSARSLVSQISDGQPQAGSARTTSSARVVSQISDGQPQAGSARTTSSARVVSQISDGQPQAGSARTTSSARVVSQISDGQPQAGSARSTSSVRVVSQISDGQPQAGSARATTSSARVVTQISDGQPQVPAATSATNSTVTRPAVSQFTGAAATGNAAAGAMAVGIAGLFALL